MAGPIRVTHKGRLVWRLSSCVHCLYLFSACHHWTSVAPSQSVWGLERRTAQQLRVRCSIRGADPRHLELRDRPG